MTELITPIYVEGEERIDEIAEKLNEVIAVVNALLEREAREEMAA